MSVVLLLNANETEKQFRHCVRRFNDSEVLRQVYISKLKAFDPKRDDGSDFIIWIAESIDTNVAKFDWMGECTKWREDISVSLHEEHIKILDTIVQSALAASDPVPKPQGAASGSAMEVDMQGDEVPHDQMRWQKLKLRSPVSF